MDPYASRSEIISPPVQSQLEMIPGLLASLLNFFERSHEAREGGEGKAFVFFVSLLFNCGFQVENSQPSVSLKTANHRYP